MTSKLDRSVSLSVTGLVFDSFNVIASKWSPAKVLICWRLSSCQVCQALTVNWATTQIKITQDMHHFLRFGCLVTLMIFEILNWKLAHILLVRALRDVCTNLGVSVPLVFEWQAVIGPTDRHMMLPIGVVTWRHNNLAYMCFVVLLQNELPRKTYTQSSDWWWKREGFCDHEGA